MHKGRQATGRATHHPVLRTKGGKTYWVARGVVPIKRSTGEVTSRPVERSFGVHIRTESQRLAQCEEWNREAEDLFANPWRAITFARAFQNYLKNTVAAKGADRKKLPWKAQEIVEGLGEFYCAEVNDSAVLDLVDDIWPDGASPKTINRHIYTPIIAALHMALREKAPELQRPKGHRDITPVVVPPDEWYDTVYPVLSPDQVAVLMFLAMHGRRIGEALARTPKDLNLETGVLDLGKTKTGFRVIELNPKCIPYIARPGWQDRKWLFGCGPTSANSFRRDFKARCIKHGLPYFTPHSFGRHKSVTNMLQAGYSTKYVADAHGMTEAMVATRYGHLAKSEVTKGLHDVGSKLFDRMVGEQPKFLTAPVELEVVYDASLETSENVGEALGEEIELVESIKARHGK